MKKLQKRVAVLTGMLLVLATMAITQVNAKLLEPDLPQELRLPKYVMLDFYASWCSSCASMKPYIEEIKRENCNNLQIIHIDIDKIQNKKYSQMYTVTGLPTYILFNSKGKAVYKMEELDPRVLKQQITKFAGKADATCKR